MSQSIAAPRPAATVSPHSKSSTSPLSGPPELPGRGSLPFPAYHESSNGRHFSTGVPSPHYSTATSQPRSLGVQNILNPTRPEDRHHQPISDGHDISPRGSIIGQHQQQQTHHHHHSSSQQGHYFPGSESSVYPRSGHVTPTSMPNQLHNTDQSPSPAAYPFPAIHEHRSMLSPKIPRATSINATGKRFSDQPTFPNPPPGSLKRPYPGDGPGSNEATAHLNLPNQSNQYYASQRSLSQPVLGPRPTVQESANHPGESHSTHGPPSSMILPAPPGGGVTVKALGASSGGGGGGPTSGPTYNQTSSHFQASTAPGRTLSASASAGDGRGVWNETGKIHGHHTGGMNRPVGTHSEHDTGRPMVELDVKGDKMFIPVDMDKASRQANKKRERNAGASARFRQRKKERDQAQTDRMHTLEEEKRDVMMRNQELEEERDFYRNERNRLREIIARTPGISDQAAGPPSPTFSRRASFSNRSPPGPRNVMGSSCQGYASSDASSSVERPLRRRRTDSHPEFSTPIYNTPANVGMGTGLPPISAGLYGGMPPRPPSASSAPERLAPFRSLVSPIEPLSEQQQQHHQQQQQQSYPARTPELGWATSRLDNTQR